MTIDWTLREGAQAKIRVMVKRILNKHGYPPDLQDAAVKTVLKQAEQPSCFAPTGPRCSCPPRTTLWSLARHSRGSADPAGPNDGEFVLRNLWILGYRRRT